MQVLENAARHTTTESKKPQDGVAAHRPLFGEYGEILRRLTTINQKSVLA